MKKYLQKRYLLLLIPVIGIVFYFASNIGSRGQSISLQFTEARQQKINITLEENGYLEAENAINIAAPNVNYDRRLIFLIPEGSIVKKGDVLAKMDTARLEDSLEQISRSGLHAEMQDAKMDSEIKIADLKVKHQTTIENAKLADLSYKTMKYAAQIERDAALARLNNANNEIKVAANRIKQEENRAEITVRQIQDKIDDNAKKIEDTKKAIQDFTILSPESGIVVYPLIKISGITRKVQIGDLLYKSQIFLIIPNLFKMTVQIEVNEEDIRRIQVGQKTLINLDAFPGSQFTGEIYRIDPLAHVKENNEYVKVFTVSIRVKEQDLDKLRPGMNACAVVQIQSFEKAWTLPLSAVARENDGFYVWIPENNQLTKKKIEILDSNTDHVVLKEPLPSKVVIPNSSLSSYLSLPSPSLSHVKWIAAP